jgi:flagellar biosynthesis protein FlhF
MRMKSYFAGSVQLAMEQARRELGGEAILVTSRLAPAEAGKPRQYEVVFATQTPEKGASTDSRAALIKEAVKPPKETPAPATQGPSTASSIEAVLGEIKGIRQQIEALAPRQGGSSITFGNAERQMLAHLISADVDPDLAQQLLASALERIARRPANELGAKEGRFAEVLRAAAAKREVDSPDLHAAVSASINEVVRAETGFGDKMKHPVLALVGPPGTGKTTAIAKLAIRYGLGQKRPALLLSADNQRIAAPEQLKRTAAVLGLRFEHAPSVRGLSQLLEDNPNHGLILIDTPGYSASDLSEAGPLAQFLASRAEIQRHLVLPASARGSDIARVCSAYEIFRPTHLFYGRTDETTLFGPVLNEAMGRGLPLSFFSTGPEVPDDLTEATAEFLTDRLLPTRTRSLGLGAAA